MRWKRPPFAPPAGKKTQQEKAARDVIANASLFAFNVVAESLIRTYRGLSDSTQASLASCSEKSRYVDHRSAPKLGGAPVGPPHAFPAAPERHQSRRASRRASGARPARERRPCGARAAPSAPARSPEKGPARERALGRRPSGARAAHVRIVQAAPDRPVAHIGRLLRSGLAPGRLARRVASGRWRGWCDAQCGPGGLRRRPRLATCSTRAVRPMREGVTHDVLRVAAFRSRSAMSKTGTDVKNAGGVGTEMQVFPVLANSGRLMAASPHARRSHVAARAGGICGGMHSPRTCVSLRMSERVSKLDAAPNPALAPSSPTCPRRRQRGGAPPIPGRRHHAIRRAVGVGMRFARKPGSDVRQAVQSARFSRARARVAFGRRGRAVQACASAAQSLGGPLAIQASVRLHVCRACMLMGAFCPQQRLCLDESLWNDSSMWELTAPGSWPLVVRKFFPRRDLGLSLGIARSLAGVGTSCVRQRWS